MKKVIIAPSILSANMATLGQEVQAVVDAGADWIHLDVMDNHYVPNLTFGPMICSALRDYGITAHIDVHLMVSPVDSLIEAFAKAGADAISFHPEASLHVDRSVSLIKDLGCKAGLALNPTTSLECLTYLENKLDLILQMTVNPGFGGQKFITNMLPKIQQLRSWIDQQEKSIDLCLDGGINDATIKQAYEAGANAFVAGSYIYDQSDYQLQINTLRNALKG